MARFTIYSPAGVALYEGTPSFTGQYMKPGLLEFREVALPALVDLVPGCYVDYTRTGHRYRIYTAPQLKKQARSLTYGGAFVYQSVQLYDASKMLEYCPFRDLVLGDNRIHFSTQPSISTFEGCDGLARRFEACLVDQYGANSWAVRIATQAENPNLYDLMLEPREFTVSGLNILECLDKIYEIWPEVGWIYKVENGKDTIVIGGSGINPNEGTYAYGKGNGLTSLTRTAANAEEIANRIFAYGSSRNMLPRWYNSQDIKDAESVDIQNLMLPVDAIPSMDWNGWGLTEGERDAAKAFVEDSASILKNGLRPATVYFDGKGEYPEIYPSLRETTIGMVRTAIGDSTAKYYPSTAIYTDPNARVDKILSAQASFDSGKAGADGKSSTDVGYIAYDHSGATTPITIAARSVHTEAFASGTIALTGTGRLNIELSYPSIGLLTGCGTVYLDFSFGKVHGGATTTIYTQRVVMNPGDAGSYSVPEGKISYTGNTLFESGDSLAVAVNLVFNNQSGATDTSAFLTNASGTMTVKASNRRDKTFTISLRQLGFDINEQADLGNGKTIAIRTGMCAGRSFAIKSVQYNATNDCWDLECWRTEDESLSQWFPNTDYPVRGLENAGQSNEYGGDEFVLLDIAMPSIYVQMAEQKLLTAAQELLADTAVERWQYMPEIDAKFMVENGRTIRAGEFMSILDISADDITPGLVSYFRTSGGGYLLTADGEKIVISASSGSVVTVFVDTVVINEGEAAIPTYKVTLRDRKKKTWTESQSPEQSSSKSVGNITTDTAQTPAVVGDSFFELDGDGNVTLKSQYQNLWVPGWLAAGGIGTGGGGGGGSYTAGTGIDITNNVISLKTASTSSLGGVKVDGTTITINNGVISAVGGGGGGTVTGVKMNGTTYSPTNGIVNLGTVLTSFTETDPTVPSWAKQTNPSFFIGTTRVQTSSAAQALTGILSVKNSTNNSLFEWDGDNNAWHFYGNLYTDGWVSAGGIGSGSSGGGSVVTISNLLSSGTRIATITVNGTGYDILAPQGGAGTVTGVRMNGTTHSPVNGVVELGTVLTSFTETDPTVPAWAKASSKPSYTLDEIADGTNRKLSDYVTLSTQQTIDGAKTFTTNPVSIGSDSGISVDRASYIDIGDARLIYDSGANALHITRRSGGTSNLVGLFADGFVSAGGVGTQSTFSYVTLESDQTVAGAKTFVNPLSVNISGVELEVGDPVPDALTVTGNTTLTGDASITGGLSVVGNINATTFGGGLSINSDEINYGSRLYIQYNSSDLCLTKNGKTVIGTYPGSSAIGTNKLYVDGTAIATSWNTTSDFRLKADISALSRGEAIDKLMALKPATWKWNSGLAKGQTASGFIAQEVEPVLPFMVTGEDYKGLAYQMLHAYEVSAIQSHEERLRALEKKMNITEG